MKWRGFHPLLVCRFQDENNKIMELPFKERIEMHVGEGKTCIGRWENGKYIPCPTNAKVTRFSRCDACAESMIPDQQCIFEPRCSGESCHVNGFAGKRIEFCARPHTVYVAFYLTKPKVGMTSTERLRERLIEQGADAYFVVTNTENRLQARTVERFLSNTFHLRQSYSHLELLSMAHQPINKRTIEESARKLSKEIEKRTEFKPNELYFLMDYPLSLPLRSTPRETSTAGIHMGSILGVKGRFLYYHAGGISALNISELVSRTIEFNSL